MSLESGRFTVLHLSDIHATATGLLYDAVDGLERLVRAAEEARRLRITPEAVVVTGDLIQRGHSAAYAAIDRACREVEAVLGAPVITVLGNHDDRVAARALSGHRDSHPAVHTVGGYRIVCLDSGDGALGESQLEWLSAALNEPHGAGTVVALHHPPVDSPLPALRTQGLLDAAELLEVLQGTDTRAILAGHYHHPFAAALGGIPVFVGPSLAYHQVMDASQHSVAGHDAPMFSLVQFTRSDVSVAAVPLESPSPLFTKPLVHQAQKAHHVS